LKEVLECHFQDAAEQALEDVPAGMEPLYQRMEATMAKTSKGRDRELAKRLLTWAMCSRTFLRLGGAITRVRAGVPGRFGHEA
jgi:hypothetical protein